MRNNYPDPDISRTTVIAYPSPTVSDVDAQPYNATLSINQLL